MIKRRLETAREKGEPIAAAEEEKLWEEAHDWGATRLADTISDLKGFYVKRCVGVGMCACMHACMGW
jgi:hypothetical protein